MKPEKWPNAEWEFQPASHLVPDPKLRPFDQGPAAPDKPIPIRPGISSDEALDGKGPEETGKPEAFGDWVSEEAYYNRQRFGGFVFSEEGRAYEIFDPHTPRPWLNYLSNERFGSVVSNEGLGYLFYKSTALHLTAYDPGAGKPSWEFTEGRKVFLKDTSTGMEWDVFGQSTDLKCTHRPGSTTLRASIDGLEAEMKIFVPVEDPVECWVLHLRNKGHLRRRVEIRVEQVWQFAYHGSKDPAAGNPSRHRRAEEACLELGAVTTCARPTGLPFPLWGFFSSPHLSRAQCSDSSTQAGSPGQQRCGLSEEFTLEEGEDREVHVASGVAEGEPEFQKLKGRYARSSTFRGEMEKLQVYWEGLFQYPSCHLPEPTLQDFFNVWLKNQVHLNLRFSGSGSLGHHEVLQNYWGYSLMEPESLRAALLEVLSHMSLEGSCPQDHSPLFPRQGGQESMDAALWLPLALSSYVKETGDISILDEKVPYREPFSQGSVGEHAWKALKKLYSLRGEHGFCKAVPVPAAKDAGLESICRDGKLESVWLTMALCHAQNLMAEIYRYDADLTKEGELRARSAELSRMIQKYAWDGQWFIYGYDAEGGVIGSQKNEEGKIHLKPQSWALLSGLADEKQVRKIRKAVQDRLETRMGMALLTPPYFSHWPKSFSAEATEPGRGENGSIGLQAGVFDLLADIQCGYWEKAYRKLLRLMPVNPENFDARRTSEPYCIGDYYCGPDHPRFGQNFSSWFNPNAAWILRVGFDHLFGIQAGFDGIHIEPHVPLTWDRYSVKRKFRGSDYNFQFQRVKSYRKYMIVNGRKIKGRFLEPQTEKEVDVQVFY